MAPSMAESLLALNLLPLRFTLQVQTAMQLPPYKGATLRGGFGVAFKETVCVVEHRDCARCLLRSRCAYPYVFDTPILDSATRLRKYPAAPHPFVLLPALEPKQQYQPGEIFSCDCTLIGKGAALLPYFIYAFERLGAHHGLGKGRGRFTLESVSWMAPSGEPLVIYRSADQILQNTFRSVDVRDLTDAPEVDAKNGLTLRFLTPTRLVSGGSLTDKPAFHIVLRTLLRRLSNLAYFHCNTELSLDFRRLINAAEQVRTRTRRLHWYDWERYSARQDTRMKLGGFVGQVTYAGDLEAFLPLLRLGSMVHIGKGTTFGLGKYEVVGENREAF
ncbi:hypothetical protein NKDENANG_01872 [Candidatus Entotheonellaceae bacterium PAL068K]